MSDLLFCTVEIPVSTILVSNSNGGVYINDYNPYLQYKRQGLLLCDHYIVIRVCMLLSSYKLKQNMAVEGGVVESVLSIHFC
jgi:hypothetical protein